MSKSGCLTEKQFNRSLPFHCASIHTSLYTRLIHSSVHHNILQHTHSSVSLTSVHFRLLDTSSVHHTSFPQTHTLQSPTPGCYIHTLQSATPGCYIHTLQSATPDCYIPTLQSNIPDCCIHTLLSTQRFSPHQTATYTLFSPTYQIAAYTPFCPPNFFLHTRLLHTHSSVQPMPQGPPFVSSNCVTPIRESESQILGLETWSWGTTWFGPGLRRVTRRSPLSGKGIF